MLIGMGMLKEILIVLIFVTMSVSCTTPNDSGILPPPAPTAEFPFDGNWKGKMFTLVGSCRKIYTFKRATIRSSQISGVIYGNQGKYQLTGAVRSGGTTEMTLKGGDQVELTGTFETAKAEGRWKSVSGCEGTFEFNRNEI
jgi:hypothetical protein